ncbi:unnamed protein product [Nippostrongylus brasiliensis]|uniref:G_PROTEIN_RECEP_F2_4 domain-containing protein n=1 Tax=Nippostrongylus brasiliensis TaxID=27835 RepID=A0A0N4YTY9_NIPBR|nr:unnamed protein product [Nippostrongylus brasiliensis]VDL86560.1 unnamed protein product [Nippostrongylus brasiliensis]
MFMRRNKNACYRNQHRKTMRTISVLIIVYICTWLLSLVLTNTMYRVLDDTWRRVMAMLVGVLQMTCFVQTFYVCYHRSSEYRNIFRRLFKSMVLPEAMKCHIQRAWQVRPDSS